MSATFTPPFEANYVVCTSSTRPVGFPGRKIYETDTEREWVFTSGFGFRPSGLLVSLNNNVVAGGGTYSGTAYANTPTALSLAFPKKFGTDTNLLVAVAGECLVDDALVQVSIGVDIGGTDTDVAEIDTIGANSAIAFAGSQQITGLTAGTKTINVQWKVSAGTVVATMLGRWSLTVQEVIEF